MQHLKFIQLILKLSMIVAPSDHLITNDAEYVRVVNEIFDTISKDDTIVTLGIQPSRPDTGYGYIQYE
jgi:mannose-1-phosphate guanylyltransferase